MSSHSGADASNAENLLRSLCETIGPDQIAPEDVGTKYNHDWTGDYSGKALAVVRPRNTDDVSSVVRWCNRHRVPLVPQGGNTGLVAAATPSQNGQELILSMERMNGVREIDALNGVAIVEAGCVLSDFKARVEQADALFPLSIGSQGSCQIGGTISTNAGGINVVRYGMTRGLVMGLEVVLPDGRVFRDLRGLHKNNTGYDLKQVFIGAEGTLGVVTAAAVKIQPRPTQIETLFLATGSVALTVELFRRMRRDAGDLISAFELMTGVSVNRVCATEQGVRSPLPAIHPAYAIVEISSCGGPPLQAWLETYLETLLAEGYALDCVMAQNGAQASNIWDLRERIVESQTRLGPYLRTDLSTPISAIAEFIDSGMKIVETVVPGAQPLAYGHIGDGNLHFNVMRPVNMSEQAFKLQIGRLEAALFELVDKFGGSISAEHGIGIAKRSAFLERIDDVARDLMFTLKNTIDPLNIMNPGRIFAREL